MKVCLHFTKYKNSLQFDDFFSPIDEIDEIDKNRKNRESLFTFYKVAQNSLQFDEFLKVVFDVKIDFISFSFFLRRLFF